MQSKHKLSAAQWELLTAAMGKGGWITPTGIYWRVGDSLVKRGLLEHNGAPRHGGEAYKITPGGLEVMRAPALCPICGQSITLTGSLTTNGRLIGTCGDAFTAERFAE